MEATDLKLFILADQEDKNNYIFLHAEVYGSEEHPIMLFCT